MSRRVRKSNTPECVPIESDPYAVLCEAINPCSKQDHSRKKNCKDNPWCIYGLEDKEGIWAKSPSILTSLGVDPSVNLRKPSPDDPTVKIPPGGLINLGATCYLNVLIQSLYHNVLIRDAVFNMTPNLENNTEEQRVLCEVFLALQKAFTFLELSDNGVYDLRGFVDLLGLSKGVQQDPQEFNKLFFSKIEALQLPLQDSRRSDIKGLITGTENYSIVCQGCNIDSNSDHPFYELDLSVEGCKSLEEAIEGYLQKELLTGDNSYECRQCGGLQDAIRCTRIVTPPTVLYIQLLRYTYDKATFEKKKIRSDVTYPEVLSFHGEEYLLVAVLYHKGRSAYGGHYVCDVLDWQSQQWWHCDDSVVKKTTCPAHDFAAAGGGGAAAGASSGSAIDLDTASVLSVEEKNVVLLEESDDSFKPSEDGVKHKRKASGGGGGKGGASAAAAAKKQKTKKAADATDDGEDTADVPVVGQTSTTSEDAAKSGSEAKNQYLSRRKDAYMLSYVKKSAVDNREALGRVPPAQIFVDEVIVSSMEFRDRIAEFERNKAVVEKAIADRKEAYEATVSVFLPELKRDHSELPDCHFVPTVWLSRWVNGHPSTFTGLPSSVVAASLASAAATTLASSSSSSSSAADAASTAAVALDQDGMLCHLCSHGNGIKLSDLKKFKVLSDEAYLRITTNDLHPQEVNHDFTSVNYRCQQCYESHLESTSANHALSKKVQKLISSISEVEMKPESANCTRLIAKTWITLLRKQSEALTNLLKGTGKKAAQEVLANLASGDSPSILKMIEESKKERAAGGGSASSGASDDSAVAAAMAASEEVDQRVIVDLVNDDAGGGDNDGRTAATAVDVCEVFMNSKTRLDPQVNSSLLCVHNALVNPSKRALAVPLETWNLVLDLYPFAEEVGKNQALCQTCLLLNNEQQESTQKKKQQRVDELLNYPSLAALNKMKKIFPKEFGSEDVYSQIEGVAAAEYCLVDGRWLAQWRHYLKQNDFPRPDLTQIQTKLRCKHDQALIPEVFRKIPDGLLPVHVEMGKLLVCTSDECFDSTGSPIAELITEEQFFALHMAAEVTSDDFRSVESDGASSIASPAIRLIYSHESGKWEWSRQHCEECFQDVQVAIKHSNMMFKNKKISVKVYTDESKLGLMISLPSAASTVANTVATNTASAGGGASGGGGLTEEVPTRKSNRRSSAACKSYSVSLSSEDTVGTVKLKILQDCLEDGSPNSMKLFNPQGGELSKFNATLLEYQFQCTDTLYVLVRQSDEYIDFGEYAADMFSTQRGSSRPEEGFAGSLLFGVRSSTGKANGSVGSGGGSVTNVFELLDDSQDGFMLAEQAFEDDIAQAMKNSLA